MIREPTMITIMTGHCFRSLLANLKTFERGRRRTLQYALLMQLSQLPRVVFALSRVFERSRDFKTVILLEDTDRKLTT